MDKDLAELQRQWRNFAVDRGKARRLMQDEVDVLTEKMNELREQILMKERDFDDKWKNRKTELRSELDEAVKDALRAGRSAQSVLRELNSQNTVWIYGLAAEVKEEPPITAGPKAEVAEDAPEAVPDDAIEGVAWVHHDHVGVHRWLLSEDFRYIKRYGAEGTDFEGEWFVADRDYNFVAGNKDLYDKTTHSEMGKRANMLEKLLQGTYTQRIKLQPNPWIS